MLDSCWSGKCENLVQPYNSGVSDPHRLHVLLDISVVSSTSIPGGTVSCIEELCACLPRIALCRHGWQLVATLWSHRRRTKKSDFKIREIDKHHCQVQVRQAEQDKVFHKNIEGG